MQAERNIPVELKDSLIANEPFQYAHLIKFERPYRLTSNSTQLSTSSQRYTYLTDASIDVVFDDGSTSQTGAANGPQTYLANKVLAVSSISEETEAKANTFTLKLDGNSLGAKAASTATVVSLNATEWQITWSVTINLITEGFREGDKVELKGITNGIVNISKFYAPNVVIVKKIDSPISTGTGSLSMELTSDEIVSILLDKNSPEYASFINREVYIYRRYSKNGKSLGAPVLLFKGIISGVNFEDSETALTVSWSMTSHWGDFAQVRGRITSDDYHRALDQNGVPQPGSALKPIYAYDKGFNHSETSVNILAHYTVMVEKQDVAVKKGFLGLFSSVKVKKYNSPEDRTTALDIQLQAKSIPIIYGVRNVPGVPVFADTLANDSSTVYVAYALSEGEIGGVYDVLIDGNSLICNNLSDFVARSTQKTGDTVALLCQGRADRGDVLSGAISTGTEYKDYYSQDNR